MANNKKAHINKEIVRELSQLCRIACTPEQEDSLLTDMERILSYIEQLDDLNTDNVSPCSYVNLSLSKTPLRKDQVSDVLPREKVMKDAPEHIGGMFRVPSILKE